MAKSDKKTYPCRICGFDHGAPVRDEFGLPQYDYCDACGAEVGVVDENPEDVRAFRTRWINRGSKWWSKYTSSPKDWNPQEQMKNIPPEWR